MHGFPAAVITADSEILLRGLHNREDSFCRVAGSDSCHNCIEVKGDELVQRCDTSYSTNGEQQSNSKKAMPWTRIPDCMVPRRSTRDASHMPR
jgi:hypothetical protein